MTTILTFNTLTQDNTIDSLEKKYLTTRGDSLKTRILKSLTRRLLYLDIKKFKMYSDSLLSIAIKNNNTRLKGYAYDHFGNYYRQKSDNKQALYFFHKSLQEYQKLSSKFDIAFEYGNIGSVYSIISNEDSTMHYLYLAIELNKEVNNTDQLSYNYYNIAVFNSRHNKTYEAISNLIEAKKYCDTNNNLMMLTAITSMIGSIYLDVEIYSTAKKYFLEALEYSKKDNNKIQEANQYINLGALVSLAENDHYKAIDFYRKAIRCYSKLEEWRGISTSLANIGRNYLNLAHLDSASFYVSKALEIAKEINFEEELSNLYTNVGEIELEKRNLNFAERMAYKGISLSKEYNYQDNLAQALLLLADIQFAKKKYKDAFINLKEGQLIIDSLVSLKKSTLISNIQTKYETDKKEKEILTLEKEKAEKELFLARESKQKLLFAIAFFGLVLLLIPIAFLYWRIRRQKQLIIRLQGDLHHRVKGNLARISSFIKRAAREIDDQEVKEKLSVLQSRIKSMMEIHNLLHKKGNQITHLNMKEYVKELSDWNLKSFEASNVKVEMEIPDKLEIISEKSFVIGLIINEFITNSLRYAFPKNENGMIWISIKSEKDDYLLSMRDNGIGLPKDFNMEDDVSFGMQIMQLLAEEIHGEPTFDGSNGMKFNVSFEL